MPWVGSVCETMIAVRPILCRVENMILHPNEIPLPRLILALRREGRSMATVDQPTPDVGSAAITKPVRVVCWSTIRNTSGRTGVGIAECMHNNLDLIY